MIPPASSDDGPVRRLPSTGTGGTIAAVAALALVAGLLTWAASRRPDSTRSRKGYHHE